MTNKTSRNDTCAGGSGIKYKKCCLNKQSSEAEVLDYAWSKLRQTEGIVVDKHLIPYICQELPKEAIKTALEGFCFEGVPEKIDEELLFKNFFIPWLLFNWLPSSDFGIAQFDSEKTLAQNYVKNCKSKLNSIETHFINSMADTYYSFYNVLDVEFEKSLLVKDIMLETTHTIKEKQGTRTLKRGDAVFSRILTLDDQSIFVGMAPFTIPARYNIDLIDFRKWLIEENGNNELTTAALRNEFDAELRNYFFDIMDAALNMPFPKLTNTDGDLIQFSKAYFKLTISPEKALSKLLSLTLSKNAKEFLNDAKRDKLGTIQQIIFPWLRVGNKKHKNWDNTVMGHVTLENNRLILETNSSKRTEQGKKLLSKYLGSAVSFQQTLIESPEQIFKSSLKNDYKKTLTEPGLTELPEVQEQIRKMAKAHWESWFDEPIPALDNKTPLEAAKTKLGREKLEALLLQYERHDQESNNNIFKTDIKYLKNKLSLK